METTCKATNGRHTCILRAGHASKHTCYNTGMFGVNHSVEWINEDSRIAYKVIS